MVTAQGSHAASRCSQDQSGSCCHELGLVCRVVNAPLLGRLRIRDWPGVPRPTWITVVVNLILLRAWPEQTGSVLGWGAGSAPLSQAVGLDRLGGAGGLAGRGCAWPVPTYPVEQSQL